MSASIIPQLVKKDLHIMKSILYWWVGGVAAVAATVVAGSGFFLFGMILFVLCMAGAGVHAVMQTVVEERREQTLPFIMSLPITVREYTTAKLIANLAIFGSVWLTLSCASFVVFIGPEGMPNGAFPFVTIVLVGIFLAYTAMLSTSLISESIGSSIASTVWANIGTQLFLWWVASLHGIRSVVGGNVAVWNGTGLHRARCAAGLDCGGDRPHLRAPVAQDGLHLRWAAAYSRWRFCSPPADGPSPRKPRHRPRSRRL